MSFNHLHVHTEYSELDGMGRVGEYLNRAKELGMSAMAVTDHGTCAGLYDLFKLAPKYGIKPIYGCEFYLKIEDEKKRNHVVLLAKTQKGLANIFKLHEIAHTVGFHGKPMVTLGQLTRYSEGVICLSACLANIIPRSLANGRSDIAKEYAILFKELYGEDFYLEVQSNDIPEQAVANKGLAKLSRELGIPLVATNDVHYELKSDYQPHDVMIALQTKSKVNDVKRFRFDGNSYWFKSEDEMTIHGLSEEERLMALHNTQVIADKCNATIPKGNFLPPYHSIEEGKTEGQMLREKVTRDYKENILRKGLHTNKYKEDVFYELEVIEDTGYAGYFLIVSDFIRHARENNIVVGDGRGSGAGSKVAYITGITKVEPDAYNLLFERFLSKGRVPDIDNDFADISIPFRYLQEKYGEANVARILARGTFAPRAVIRKVFSAFDYPMGLISQITKSVPEEPKITLEKAYKKSPELVDYKKKYPKEFAIIERLEGRTTHFSKHAGGVIIYPNLNELIPLHADSDDRTMRVASFDHFALEDLGFCKIDILGLQALETINTTLVNIKEVLGKDIDLDEINYEDEAIYKDLCEGKVSSVFQIEGQKDYTMRMQPKCFKDLIALNAIVRPGTCNIEEFFKNRQNGGKKINPLRKPYLEESAGMVIYQEQFEQDCQTFAGWSIAFADSHVRKNKDLRNDTELKNKFISDSTSRGHNQTEMEELWEEIVTIAQDYGFNKSHATSYARVMYKTAWLKHYYPTFYYASSMTKIYQDDKKKDTLPNLIAECKSLGISILPPDINKSVNQFLPSSEGIRYALTSVKGLGESAIEHLTSLRPIHSLEDLVSRATRKFLKENVVDNLIKAGCFDERDTTRYEILKRYKALIKSKKEVEEKTDMEYEFEALGIYLQQHPLDKYAFQPLQSFVDNSNCLIAGIVKEVSETYDKNGQKMAFITLENQFGLIKCLAFASYWQLKRERKLYTLGNIVMIRGRRSGESCLINSAEILEEVLS